MCHHPRRSLDDFQERKAAEIYAHLRERRGALEAQARRKERLRAETRAAAKVLRGGLPPPACG